MDLFFFLLFLNEFLKNEACSFIPDDAIVLWIIGDSILNKRKQVRNRIKKGRVLNNDSTNLVSIQFVANLAIILAIDLSLNIF